MRVPVPATFVTREKIVTASHTPITGGTDRVIVGVGGLSGIVTMTLPVADTVDLSQERMRVDPEGDCNNVIMEAVPKLFTTSVFFWPRLTIN